MLDFIQLAKSEGISMEDAKIVVFRHSSGSDFDPVVGLHAREAGGWIPGVSDPYIKRGRYGVKIIKEVPAGLKLRWDGVARWQHHVVLEKNGLIFDFDFMNQPTVFNRADYIDAMLLPDDENERQEVLHQLQVEITSPDLKIKIPAQVLPLFEFIEYQ